MTRPPPPPEAHWPDRWFAIQKVRKRVDARRDVRRLLSREADTALDRLLATAAPDEIHGRAAIAILRELLDDRAERDFLAACMWWARSQPRDEEGLPGEDPVGIEGLDAFQQAVRMVARQPKHLDGPDQGGETNGGQGDAGLDRQDEPEAVTGIDPDLNLDQGLTSGAGGPAEPSLQNGDLGPPEQRVPPAESAFGCLHGASSSASLDAFLTWLPADLQPLMTSYRAWASAAGTSPGALP